MTAPTAPLVAVEDLRIRFATGGESVQAVDGLSFALRPGEVRAFVGESGSGKSVTARALAGLLPSPPRCTVTGSIRFAGREVGAMGRRERQRLRGGGIGYVFQEPSSAIHPSIRLGAQLVEVIRLHRPEVADPRAEAIAWLERVRLPRPGAAFQAFSHELSGGMLQRVMIALALAPQPRLLVADEPTTALDVTVEREVIDLLRELQAELRLAILLITHNFGIVQGFAQHIDVLRDGRIVESGAADDILHRAQHPYTQALLRCRPRLGQPQSRLYSAEVLRH